MVKIREATSVENVWYVSKLKRAVRREAGNVMWHEYDAGILECCINLYPTLFPCEVITYDSAWAHAKWRKACSHLNGHSFWIVQQYYRDSV